jgi:cytoskeletal protein CcmA (bactofilin family)
VSEVESFVSRGAFFEGKLAFRGTIRIDGHLRGDVRGDGTLVVGDTGLVEAGLEVGSLVVLGVVVGPVVAKARVHVAPGGRIEGRISTPRLVVEDGAFVAAKVEMGER